MTTDEQPTLQAEVVRTACGILDRTIGVTEGARCLTAPGSRLGTDRDSDFTTFVGIDSETDWFPPGAVRSGWDSGALARYDAERPKTEEFYREHAERACRSLIQRYAEKA